MPPEKRGQALRAARQLAAILHAHVHLSIDRDALKFEGEENSSGLGLHKSTGNSPVLDRLNWNPEAARGMDGESPQAQRGLVPDSPTRNEALSAALSVEKGEVEGARPQKKSTFQKDDDAQKLRCEE